MPRPRIDTDRIRETLLLAAERRLKRLGPARFSVTDLAADCGMSQSNIYRFFPNRGALMAALAERWFQDIEAELAARIGEAPSWQEKLLVFVDAQRTLKSARFDEDPELFRAYLGLAADHPEPVAMHVNRLQETLAGVLTPLFSGQQLEAACCLVEDATQMFRDPYAISRLRGRCTEDRAAAVLAAIIRELEHRLRAGR